MVRNIFIMLVITSGILFAQNAQEIMQKNGCFSCHALSAKKNAPAFACIGKRNKKFKGAIAKDVIMNSIKHGSKGKYPRCNGKEMPSFPNLSQKELSTLADYILKHSFECHHKGNGMMRRGMGMMRGMGE